MPESESKPKLIELIGPGTGQGWKAVLRNGKPAVVHEIPVPPAEATAAVPRLQRLFEHRHPALSPVLAWGTDQNGVWVAVEPNEGTPLSSILARGPLTPPAAAALGAAVLSGVAALHEAGIAMGGFGATAVRVTNNGEVRLAGHPAAAVRAAPSQSDLRADVRSCGMAVCAAFGVDPAGAPAPANISPGLVVTMRSMASGAMGPSADRAQGALREMAAALLSPDREMSAQSELATRAGGREVPPITPFLPAGTVASPATPTTAPTPPAQPAAPSPAAAPAPYIAPQRRDETPARAPLPHLAARPAAPRRGSRRCSRAAGLDPPRGAGLEAGRDRPRRASRWRRGRRPNATNRAARPPGPDQRAGAQAVRGPPAVAGRPFVRTPALARAGRRGGGDRPAARGPGRDRAHQSRWRFRHRRRAHNAVSQRVDFTQQVVAERVSDNEGPSRRPDLWACQRGRDHEGADLHDRVAMQHSGRIPGDRPGVRADVLQGGGRDLFLRGAEISPGRLHDEVFRPLQRTDDRPAGNRHDDARHRLHRRDSHRSPDREHPRRSEIWRDGRGGPEARGGVFRAAAGRR